jgi:hypothetical protein
MPARVMRIHPQIMAQAVREEGHTCSRFEDVIFVPLQDSKTNESVDGGFVGGEMDLVPENTLLEHVGAGVFHLGDDIIDRPAVRAEFPGYGEGSRLYVGLAGLGYLQKLAGKEHGTASQERPHTSVLTISEA